MILTILLTARPPGAKSRVDLHVWGIAPDWARNVGEWRNLKGEEGDFLDGMRNWRNGRGALDHSHGSWFISLGRGRGRERRSSGIVIYKREGEGEEGWDEIGPLLVERCRDLVTTPWGHVHFYLDMVIQYAILRSLN